MRLKNFLLCVTSSIIFLQSINPSVEWPDPTPWPEQFHALLCMTLYSGGHQITDLWYDWPKGRNVNLQQKQLGVFMPDFLDGANYLGTEVKDGFLCNVWEKVDFIWYYEDVATKRPVRWDFYDGIITHVMTFEVGATLPDSTVQAPEYCFTAQKDV
ncbi:hypothetical protein SCA6_011267 [Theobroma cacao]